MARILTIEDSAVIRALLVAALEDHEVVEAEDGETGLELVAREPFDLVLLDLGLPGIHGSQVLETLKSDPATRDIPVIIVSAWGEATTERVARARGATDVVAKPFAVEDLRARVQAALDA